MDDRRIDILGESLELPEELSALTGEFPTRPTVLPDELRGALLLPSDSGTSGSFSEGRSGDDSSLEDLIKRTMGSHGSGQGSDKLNLDRDGRHDSLTDLVGLGMNPLNQHSSEDPVSVRSVSEELHMSQASSNPSVGLSGCSIVNATPNSLGESHGSKSKSDKSRDWSLSDTDLKELLDKGNDFDLVTPLASSLVMVPETKEFLAGDSGPMTSVGKPRNDILQGAISSLSSPSQSCSHETSGSASSRNQVAALGHSPPQSSTSGSKSIVTNWSGGTHAVMSSSMSTIGGRTPNIGGHGRAANEDILESSITSSDSNLV